MRVSTVRVYGMDLVVIKAGWLFEEQPFLHCSKYDNSAAVLACSSRRSNTHIALFTSVYPLTRGQRQLWVDHSPNVRGLLHHEAGGDQGGRLLKGCSSRRQDTYMSHYQ